MPSAWALIANDGEPRLKPTSKALVISFPLLYVSHSGRDRDADTLKSLLYTGG